MTAIQTRKQPLIAVLLCCGQRFQNRFAAFRAYLAGPIGPLVADDAAHKGLTADHAQGILRTQTPFAVTSCPFSSTTFAPMTPPT